MITIQFSAPSHPELCSMLRSYLSDMDGDTPAPAAAEPAAPVAGEAPKRRGRPPKAEVQEPAPSAAVTAPAEEPAETEVTIDDVKAALAALSEAHGIQAARDVCVSFEVASIKALPAARYGEFVAACKARAA